VTNASETRALARHRPEGMLLVILLAGALDLAIAVFVGFGLLRSEVWTFALVAIALLATGLVTVLLLRRAGRERAAAFTQIAEAFDGHPEEVGPEFLRELLTPIEPAAAGAAARLRHLVRFRVHGLHCALFDLSLREGVGGSHRTLLLCGPLAELGRIDTQVPPPNALDAWSMRVAGDHALVWAGDEWIATDELPRFTGLALQWVRKSFGV
jgi:hypothetical protein